jgi:parvulin-like peptidyl-prolyl isomerase
MLAGRRYLTQILWLLVISLSFAACGTRDQTPSVLPLPSATQEMLPSETVTSTPLPPSPTPVPLAATVNGEAITLEEFQAELARFQAAGPGEEAASEIEAQEKVLDDLINQMLLAQAARENGFGMGETQLGERIGQLIEKAGGEANFREWLAEQSYSEESFRNALLRSVEAAWMRDQILSKVPETAEQVHTRQILLYNSDQAQEVLVQLEAGNDFATLAATYNPTTVGDLGWFPRGYLAVPGLEEAAFSLEPGEFSDIIESDLGYHILQVIERDPDRPLEPDALLMIKEKALGDWLEMRRSESEILIMLPDL